MSFYERLQSQTQAERQRLQSSPLVTAALAGKVDRDTYAAFLGQAYHHVKHTTPLLMAAGSRMPQHKEWLRTALAEYIEEEVGHQEWILNDIRACGYDVEAVRVGQPNAATEFMVAYAYHVIDRQNPVGFFGMVHVLEGTSVAVADSAAEAIAVSTGLGPECFSYLRSHGALDVEHVQFFRELMDRIEDPGDQAAIVHCARRFYDLYAGVYASVQAGQVQALAA